MRKFIDFMMALLGVISVMNIISIAMGIPMPDETKIRLSDLFMLVGALFLVIQIPAAVGRFVKDEKVRHAVAMVMPLLILVTVLSLIAPEKLNEDGVRILTIVYLILMLLAGVFSKNLLPRWIDKHQKKKGIVKEDVNCENDESRNQEIR